MSGLKLPGIQKGSASSLHTPDPMLPIREANVRSAAFKAIGVPVQEAAGRYVEREDKRELQEATLAVHESDNQFMVANKGKVDYSIMDIDDPNFMTLAEELGYTDVGQPIPQHRVYAEWRAKNYKDSVEQAAKGITRRDSRDAFVNAHRKQGSTNYTKDAVAATGDQIKYSAQKTMEAIDASLAKRDYTGARLAVNTSDIPEETKSATNRIIDTQEQTDYFSEVIENRDLEVMKLSLGQLNDNDPATTSDLDAEKQKVLANQLRTAINTEETAITSALNSDYKIQVDDSQSQVEDIWANKPVDMTEYVSNYNAIKKKNPVLAREMEWTQKHQPTIGQIMMSPPSAQVQSLNELKKASSGGREASYMIDKLEKAITAGQIARRTDALKWAQDVGFVISDPIDYSSAEAAQASLAARVKPILSIQRRYGSFTGFLTKDELIEFGGRLENAPNKLEYFESINSALGEHAESFYEQLKEYNIGETATLAGQIMTWGEGYRPMAENILKGSRLRKEDKMTQLVMKEQRPELEAYAVERFGGIFTGNKTQQSLNMEAFFDLYAVLKDKEAAFEQLTGGTIDYKGYTLQSPIPGMSGWSYKSHLKDLAPEYWAKPEMQAYGFTPKQLKKGILSGDLKQVGVGRGVSYLETEAGMRVKQADGVSDFLFKFDTTAPTRSGAALGRQKDREAQERIDKAERAGKTKAGLDLTNEWIDQLRKGRKD